MEKGKLPPELCNNLECKNLKLFDDKELVKIISWAKEERIDKQYYVETQQMVKVTKESCNKMIIKAEDFLVKMKLLINELSNEKISSARDSFVKLLG